MTQQIYKTYEYKITSPTGVYLGLLKNVTSDFGYNQNIATVGAQIQITVAQSADTSQLFVDPILGEDGNPLTDESSNNLTIERQPEIVGSSNPNALINNNNLVQVYEYSQYYPMGLLVFSGYISKWKAVFGSANNVVITCLSLGQDLQNYVVQTGDSASISQTTDNGNNYKVWSNPSPGDFYVKGQTFTPASSILIGGISLELTTYESGQLDVYVYAGSPTVNQAVGNTTPLATGAIHLGAMTKSVQKVTFLQPTTLAAGQPYYFLIRWFSDSVDYAPTNVNNGPTIWANTTGPYGGKVLNVANGGTYDYVQSIYSGVDLYFIIWAHGTSTTAPYVSKDPTYILTDILGNYASSGGMVTIPSVQISPLVSSQLNDATMPMGAYGTAFAQIFTPGSNVTMNIAQLFIGTSTPQNVKVQLVKGDPSLDTAAVTSSIYTYTVNAANTVLGTSNATFISNTSPATNSFSFNTPINLISGQKYYLLVTWGSGTMNGVGNGIVDKGGSTGETVSDTQVGRVYISNALANNASAYPALNNTFPYLYFNIAYLNPLPANLAGGYANTGITTTYTFKLQTVLQAIQTIASLAPANWYWYVDPATNQLNWTAANTVADFTVIRGKHINDLDIEATKENIKNIAYFSGGDDGSGTSTNILVKRTATQGTNRVGLGFISDNRVNSTNGGVTTAKLIADGYLNNNANETYITNIVLQDGTVDVNKFKLGMMIGFAGWGNFVESLLLQVVGIQRKPDQVILQLGTLPVRSSLTVSQIQAQLAYLQTVNTTTTPS